MKCLNQNNQELWMKLKIDFIQSKQSCMRQWKSSMRKKIVVALGGNALGNSPEEQLRLVKQTA